MPTKRGDKWEGRLKIAGRVVRTRRFDTKRAATDWERRQRTSFDDHGYDPSSGKVSVEVLIGEWLEQRVGKVSPTTLKTDHFLLPTKDQLSGKSKRDPVLPTWLASSTSSKSTPRRSRNGKTTSPSAGSHPSQLAAFAPRSRHSSAGA